MANELIAIQFIKAFCPYSPGQIASFKPSQADQLITDGYAVYYSTDLDAPTEYVDPGIEYSAPEPNQPSSITVAS